MFIGLAWGTYPLAGAAQVAIYIQQGKRPADAGFSFLPEVLIFPLLFFGIAAGINSRAEAPTGSWLVAGLCCLMLAWHLLVLTRYFLWYRSPRH
jgi:hypothetical protein